MSKIDTDVLRYKLSRARLCKDFEPEPPPKVPPDDQSNGLKYLIKNVFNPLLYEQTVHTADLDFNKFDYYDMEDLESYYYDYFHNGTRDWEKLKKVYTACNKTPPISKPVCFI